MFGAEAHICVKLSAIYPSLVGLLFNRWKATLSLYFSVSFLPDAGTNDYYRAVCV